MYRLVRSAEIAVEHQSNRVLNAEIAETKSAPVWLHHNKYLDNVESTLDKRHKAALEVQNKINVKRKAAQEAILEELIKNKFQRESILLKCLEIRRRCEELEMGRK